MTALQNSGLTPDKLDALKNATRPPSIDFGRNSLGYHEAAYLRHWPPLSRMEFFRLTGCEMLDETREMLLASPHAAKFHLDGDTQ